MTAFRSVHRYRPSPVRRGIAAGCLLVLCGLTIPASLPAQPPLREQTSLKFIPDDAAFYGSSLRLKQQFDNFTRSRAFARLRELSFVKEAVEQIKQQWAAEAQAPAAAQPDLKKTKPVQAPAGNGDEPDSDDSAMSDADWNEMLGELKAFWSNPENQKLVSLSLDALSHEVFFYGDSSIVSFVTELGKLNIDLSGMVSGGFDDSSDISPDHPVFKLLLDSLEKLPVPAFVVGFKVSDQAGTKVQLARLEAALHEAFQELPDLAQAFRREKIGPGEFLTLKLDGSKIPWDELIDAATADEKGETPDEKPKGNAKEADDDDSSGDAANELTPEQTKALIKALAASLEHRSLTISLGLYEGYLLFSFGETNAHLTKFSGKGKRLLDRAELAPLLKSADKPLTGIDYVSSDLAAILQTSSDNVEGLSTFLETWGDTFGIAEDSREKLVEDIKSLVADVAQKRPNAGAVVGWQYLTPRGYEGYSYDYGGGDKSLDSSKKLTILEHVGGNPLIVVAARHKGQLEGYQLVSKALAVVTPHVDSLLSANLPGEEAGQYAQIKQEFAPLLERFHTITQKQLLPALADGQSAFVLDDNTFTKLVSALLPTAGPLPIPAPALVYGVKDAVLLKQACSGYFGLLQDTVTALNRILPDQIPALPLPPPVERDAPGGTLYVYPIVGEEGDDEVGATGALGPNVAVLSLVPAQAKRFLTKTKFQPTGVLARSDQPAARVWYVNVAGLIEMIQPWVDSGIEISSAGLSPDDLGDAVQTVKTIMEVVKCWRRSAGIQYLEGSALVEHSESVFEDLK